MPSLNTVIKQASRGADLYFVFRFLRLLTMKYEKTDAYKYGIIDKKGKILRKSSELETTDEKASYTMLHRLVFKIRGLIEKVPILGKSILLNYAAALFLLKEQKNPRIWTDEKYMERELNKFLESDWEEEAEQLKEMFQQEYGKSQTSEFLLERKMTDAEMKKREEIVLSLKKKKKEFQDRYGDEWKDVMYATATKMAMGEAFYDLNIQQINSYLKGLASLPKKQVIDHLKKHFNLKKIKMDMAGTKVLAFEENEMESFKKFKEDKRGPCWRGYVQKGMKKKGNKLVPNCVPEEVEIGEDKKWHYYNLDRGVYRLQKDNNGKIIGKMHDRQKEMRAGFPNADEVLSTTKQAAAKVAKLNEQVGVRKVDFVDGVTEAVPTTSTAGVVGTGDDPATWKRDPKKKKKDEEELRKMMGESVKTSTFAGKQVFVVDSDMFHQCRLGKAKYHRYEKYVGKKRIGKAIREYGLKFPKRPIILQNGEGGPMLYLRYGRS